MPKKKFFASNLKYLRNKNDMEQQELADKLGRKSGSTVSDWERGKFTPRMGTVDEIAEIFDVDIDTLLYSDMTNTEVDAHTPITKTSAYPFYPHSISAGNPFHADGVTQLESIELPDFVMGKYARSKDLLIMRINGESMNRLIPHDSLIAIKNVDISQLKDGDIVVYSHQNEYSVKQFYRRGNDVIFKPMSEDPTFTDYVVKEDDPELLVHGKVAIYIVER